MNFCPKCGISLDPQDTFCHNCGKALRPTAPVEETTEAAVLTPVATEAPVQEPVRPPVYNPIPAPQVVAPLVRTVPTASPVSAGTKAKGFVGMGLSIGGLVFAVLGIIYTLFGFVAQADSYGSEPIGFIFALYLGIFSFPLSIVGRIFANKSYESGNQHGSCTAGVKIGLAGLIVSCAMMMLGFISLLASIS